MRVKYILEYNSKTDGKRKRIDLGNDISLVELSSYNHLTAGDYNVIIFPVLEEGENTINIVDNVEVKDVN